MPILDERPPLHYAQAWKRFVAQVVDGIIFVPFNYLLMFSLSKQYLLQNTIFFSVMALYYLVALYSSWQATPGQRLMKIYLITKEGLKPSFVKVFFRYFAFIFPIFPAIIPSFYILLLTPEELATKVNGQHYQYIHELVFSFYAVLAIIIIAVAVLLLIWYVPVLFTKEKKSMPDMLCGTRIVKGKATR